MGVGGLSSGPEVGIEPLCVRPWADIGYRGILHIQCSSGFHPGDGRGRMMTHGGRLRHHLEGAVKGHQSRFDAQLRMALSELLAKRGQGVPVGLRLGSGVGNSCRTVGNLRRATVTMVDHDDLVDPVQLERGLQVVPERFVPVLECGSHDTDGCASDRELAVLAGEMTSSSVLADEFLKAWVDTGQDHRLIFAAGRKRVQGRSVAAVKPSATTCKKRRRAKDDSSQAAL